MTVYRATVTREDDWWMIHIPELDLLTQAMNWSEVTPMARGVIAATLDINPADVEIDVALLPDPDVRYLMDEAARKAAEADKLNQEVLAAKQEAARTMHKNGWSYRLIGKAMHLTHQRAEQLVKGHR